MKRTAILLAVVLGACASRGPVLRLTVGEQRHLGAVVVQLSAEVRGQTWCPGAVEFYWTPRYYTGLERSRQWMVHGCTPGPYLYPRIEDKPLVLACGEWRLGVRVYPMRSNGWPDDRPAIETDKLKNLCGSAL